MIADTDDLMSGLILGASARLASAAGCLLRPEQHCVALGYRHGEGDAMVWVPTDGGWMV